MKRIALALILGSAAATFTHAEESKLPVRATASGEFDVKIVPLSAKEEMPMRLSIDKIFRGDLTGESKGQMMASGGAQEQSGAYVALETVTGSLQGKKGSFVLAHRGMMTPTSQSLSVLIVPGTGTGELAGIEGSVDIRIEGKKHFYTIDYAIAPAKP